MSEAALQEEIVMTAEQRLTLFNQIHGQFQRMVSKEANKISGILGALSQNTITAEDITQEMWMNIMANLHTYDESRGGMSTWITLRCKTVRHQMLAYVNSEKRSIKDKKYLPLDKPIVESENPIGDVIGNDSDMAEQSLGVMTSAYYIYLIALFLDKLQETQRSVIGAHLLNIKSSVVMERFGISRQAYSQSKDRGVKRLREYIKNRINSVDHDTATAFCEQIASGEYSSDIGVSHETYGICKAILDKLVRGM